MIKMLSSEEGIIRKALFNDNVRDYQGNTEINDEIYKTLQTTPERFTLLNNGITIVCTGLVPSNRKVTIANPQVVNGCQTCSVLFEAYRQGVGLDDVMLIAKIIATEKDEITNAIVKGTNRQNLVYGEAFEITKEFHKDLEEFFQVMQSEIPLEDKIFYERRSKQYANDPTIKVTQRIGFKTLTQSFVSIFLRAPHEGSTYEAILLQKFQNVIYVDDQSYYPYFLAALMRLNFERLMREQKIERKYMTFENHILLIVSEQIAGVAPDINHTKRIDEYCLKLLDTVQNINEFEVVVNNSIVVFNKVRKQWIDVKGRQYRHGMKDNAQFSKFMVISIRGGDPLKKDLEPEPQQNYRGRVVKVKRDRNGMYYGYISKAGGDIFVHESDNHGINFEYLYGKDVTYHIFQHARSGVERAKIIAVLPS